MMNDTRTLLETAYIELETELSAALRRALRAVRSPEMKWVRIVTGTAFVAGGCMAFLPVLGIELLPIGLLLLAEDVPVLREPAARAVLWALQLWRSFKAWIRSWVPSDKAAAAH
jgi:hypothetical protein